MCKEFVLHVRMFDDLHDILPYMFLHSKFVVVQNLRH